MEDPGYPAALVRIRCRRRDDHGSSGQYGGLGAFGAARRQTSGDLCHAIMPKPAGRYDAARTTVASGGDRAGLRRLDHRRRLRWRIPIFRECRARAARRRGGQPHHLCRNIFQNHLPSPAHGLCDFAAQHGREHFPSDVSHRPICVRNPAGGARRFHRGRSLHDPPRPYAPPLQQTPRRIHGLMSVRARRMARAGSYGLRHPVALVLPTGLDDVEITGARAKTASL